MTAELCRDIAAEAARRTPTINVHELWAVLEAVDARRPRVVVDLWSDPAVWWAWWSLGCRLIGVAPAPLPPGRGFRGSSLPRGVDVVVGDPRETATRCAVSDLAGDEPIDVLVLGGPESEDGVWSNWAAYAPMVRPRGLAVVHGIANDRYPGIGRFWSAISAPSARALVGNSNPDGYGVVEIHGKELTSHG